MKNSKTELIPVRFSPEELKLIEANAKRSGMPLSTYIREKVLYDVPKLEEHSFEFKVLKGIGYCVASIATVTNLKLKQKELDMIEVEAERIMKNLGIDESLLRPRV